MATAARLNQLKSPVILTNRKRLRSSDAHEATPAKRRHVENEIHEQTPIATQPIPRGSATSLRRRPNRLASSPVRTPHGPGVYDLQESPGMPGKNKSPAEKVQPENKIGGKKRRVLNRKIEKAPVHNGGYDQQREGKSNPLLIPGVTLSSVDSPAKNTRARREQPLRKLDPDRYKPVPVDAEPVREASPELGEDGQHEVPFTSGQQRQEHDVAESSSGSEAVQHQPEVAESDRDNVADTTTGDGINIDKRVLRTGNKKTNDQIQARSPVRQRITEQDRNYLRRLQEENARNDQQVAEENNAADRGTASQVSPKKAVEKEKQKKVTAASQRERNPEDEAVETSEEEGQVKVPKKKGRKKMSEEEKKARKEEEAQRRQENALETEAAEIRVFAARGKEFVEDVDDAVMQIGGPNVWSKLGAGAKTITAMVARKKNMDEARAQTLWNKLHALKDVFMSEDDANEDRVSHLIKSLQAKSSWQVLTRDGKIKEGDKTIIDLYEYVIPQSIYVIKEQLKGRFVAAHSVTWQELRSLVEIAIGLCDVAADWQPKPTNLETGIRQQVRHNIRPSLVGIQNAVRTSLELMEWKQRQEREHASFTKRQVMKKEEKRRTWARINQPYTSNQTPQPVDSSPNRGGSQPISHEIEQAEGIFNNHVRKPITKPSRRVSPPPPLRRRPTEEIPAPDPNTSWSEKENVALLNGLQKYLGDDRYSKILDDPDFAKALRGKDADQCMARALFFQSGCRQILKEKEDEGDSSFDWLRSV